MPGLFLGPLCAKKRGRERLLLGGQGQEPHGLTPTVSGQSLLPRSSDRRINRDPGTRDHGCRMDKHLTGCIGTC